jgi:TonB family protein
MCTLVALAVTGAAAQQGAPAAGPGPVIEKSPAVVPYKPAPKSANEPLKTCPAKFEYRPEDGIYMVGGSITPPKVTQYVIARLTKDAQKAYKNNLFKDPNEIMSSISVVVDTNGHPQNLCLQRSAGFGLDEEAANEVRQYRFKPAARNGTPVAVRITIEVRFAAH